MSDDLFVFPAHNRQTHCKHGHPYTAENTSWKTNWKGVLCRECKACGRERMRRKRLNPNYRIDSRARQRKHRQSQGETYLAYVRKSRREKKIWVDSFKVKCRDCSETHVACLDFHHRDPKQKKFNLSTGYARYEDETLYAEIMKCDVICANCHRKLHYEERQDKQEGVVI